MTRPHVCICGDCSLVPFEDRCGYEAEAARLREALERISYVVNESTDGTTYRLGEAGRTAARALNGGHDG